MGQDGSRSTVAMPPNPLAKSADAIQFQQSLQFLGPDQALGGLDHYSGRGAARVGR